MAINTQHRINNLEDEYAPLSHAKLIDQYRVPIKVAPPEYTIYVNKNHKRIYTEDTLPPFVMNKILIAKVLTNNYFKGVTEYWNDLYICGQENCKDIGWRATEEMYVIVMDSDEINTIAGLKLY
jgi:hypothetical protein